MSTDLSDADRAYLTLLNTDPRSQTPGIETEVSSFADLGISELANLISRQYITQCTELKILDPCDPRQNRPPGRLRQFYILLKRGVQNVYRKRGE